MSAERHVGWYGGRKLCHDPWWFKPRWGEPGAGARSKALGHAAHGPSLGRCRIRIPPTWGRWFVVWLLSQWGSSAWIWGVFVRCGKYSPAVQLRPFGPTNFPPIRAGGVFQRDLARRKEVCARHLSGGEAVALNHRGGWYGEASANISSEFIESSIGGSIADATRKLYSGNFPQCATFRMINGHGPYMMPDPRGLKPRKTSY